MTAEGREGYPIPKPFNVQEVIEHLVSARVCLEGGDFIGARKGASMALYLLEGQPMTKEKAARVRQCEECRFGEHDNLSDDVQFVTVKDPDTGKVLQRGYLCADHVRSLFTDLGQEVIGWEDKS